MKSVRSFLPEDAQFPFGGLETKAPPALLAPGLSPSTRNMTTFRGSLKTRTGVEEVVTADAVRVGDGSEPVIQLFSFEDTDGHNYLVACTPTRVFYLDTDQWVEITRRDYISHLNKDGWDITQGVFYTGDLVKQGDVYGVWLADDTTAYRICGINGIITPSEVVKQTTISVNAEDGTDETGTLTPNAASTVWTQIVDVQMTGVVTTFVDYAIGADLHFEKVFVITNGIDTPVFWAGPRKMQRCAAMPINLETFVTAKTVGVHASYFMFANILTTEGVWEPQTAAWSDTGNLGEWLNGNSGVLASMSFEGEILKMISFAQNMLVFSQDSIGCICYIDSNLLFGSQIYVTGTKLVGPKAVAHSHPFVMYVAQDNIYLFDGNRTVAAFGDAIARKWYAERDATQLAQTQLFYDLQLGQMKFVYPVSESAVKVLMCETGISSTTFYQETKSNGAKWFEHDYDFYPRVFAMAAELEDTNEVLSTVIGSDDGFIGRQSLTALHDLDDAPINCFWDTHDFTAPKQMKSVIPRWLELEFNATGTAVTLQYSTDEGETWSAPTRFRLTDRHENYKYFLDASSRQIRFRFSCEELDGFFSLDTYRVWLRPGGAR